MNHTDETQTTRDNASNGRRTAALQDLACRFRRRWVSGIVVGTLLVTANTIVFHIAIGAVKAKVGGSDPAIDALSRLAKFSAGISITSLLVLATLARWFFRPLDKTLATESQWLEAAERQQLLENARRTAESEISEALEFGSDDLRLSMITDHILETIAPDLPSELILADSSEAHMGTWAANRSVPTPGCNVPSPFDCPAVKRSRAYTAASSEAINACPHLRNRDSGPCAAHCVPVAFMGKALGVLHVTAADGTTFSDELIHRMGNLSDQLGARIGTVRAFAKAQLQASTDSLTGLENRRSIENELNDRLALGHNFAIAIADLDHFKKLNDTFGHDIGDRALRAFARAVRSTLREGDLFARWGGEEFVIALPEVSAADGVKVLHRAQLALAALCANGTVPPFTASFGITENSSSPRLEHLLRAADEALLRAKRAGRDTVCIAGVEEPVERQNVVSELRSAPAPAPAPAEPNVLRAAMS